MGWADVRPGRALARSQPVSWGVFRVRRTTTPEVRIDLAPLIDVVFLLLTFFLFAMLLMVRADALDLTLPEIASGEPAEPGVPVTIALTAAGEIRVDNELLDPAAVPERVQAIFQARGTPEPQLVLAVDEGCPAGVLIGMIDRLTGAGLGDFAVLGTPAQDAGGLQRTDVPPAVTTPDEAASAVDSAEPAP